MAHKHTVHAKVSHGLSWTRTKVTLDTCTATLLVGTRTLLLPGADITCSKRGTTIIATSGSRKHSVCTILPSSSSGTTRAAWAGFNKALDFASRSPPGYSIVREIGSGGSGVVYAAHDCSNPAKSPLVALKFISRTQLIDCETELRMARVMPVHHAILAPLRTFYTRAHLVVVMPLLPGGTLLELSRRGPPSLDSIRDAMRDLLAALTALHQHGLAHRDVKLENILRSESGGAVLCDHGLAASVPRCGFKRPCGTKYTNAPEVGSTRYGFAADVWSAGVVLLVLVLRAVPFSEENRDAVLRRMRALDSSGGDPLGALLSARRRSTLPKNLLDLLRRMLAIEPSRRITAQAALSHAWFTTPTPSFATLVMVKLRLMRLAARYRAQAASVVQPKVSEKKPSSTRRDRAVNVARAMHGLCVRASAAAESTADLTIVSVSVSNPILGA